MTDSNVLRPAQSAPRASTIADLSKIVAELQKMQELSRDLLNTLSETLEITLRGASLPNADQDHRNEVSTVEFTKQQMAVFALLRSADLPLSTDDFLDALYPEKPRPNASIINVVISNLRKKLRAACRGRNAIENVRGVGYRLLKDRLPVGLVTHETTQPEWRRKRRHQAD
jgi:DNA-binding response OmpR family regulator